MRESNVTKERTCKRCGYVIIGTAADLRKHAETHDEEQKYGTPTE